MTVIPAGRTLKPRLGLLAALAVGWAAAAHADIIAQPQALDIRVSDGFWRLDLEDRRESNRNKNTDLTFDDRESWISPVLGFQVDGSVYHPNLLDFDLFTELGYRWSDKLDEQRAVAGEDTRGSETTALQRYNGNLRFLKEKPYAVTLFGNRYDGDRDDDFYNITKVRGDRYGVTSGYSEGPFPVTVTASRWKEDVSDPVRPTDYREDRLEVRAYNQRTSGGRTTLEYTLQDYTRREPPTVTDEGVRNSVDFFDLRTFNTVNKLSLRSYVRYDQLSQSPRPSDGLTIREHFTNQHTSRWRSDYDYLLSRQKLNQSQTDNQQAQAALTHKLYDSLTSTFDVDGRYTSNDSPGSSLDTTRFGGGFLERYTKKLSTWGLLNVDAGLHVHHEERDSSGGTQTIIDEPHTLTDGDVTFLNVPQADPASIVVTDSSGTITYARVFDYTISRQGASTSIRRVPGGRIPNGSLVLVDYTAQSQPSASFDAVESKFGLRLNLLDRALAVYFRYHDISNFGGEDLVLQDLHDLTVGVESSWRALRVGAEYERYRSNLSPFRTTRLFQSLQFNPGLKSSISFDCRQAWTTFDDTDDKRQLYSFLARYRGRVTRTLAVNLEGGAHIEHGQGEGEIDQDLLTARASIDYWVGQMVLNAGYEYEYEDYRSTVLRRNYSYLSLKRNF
jgi:hypothetical protein